MPVPTDVTVTRQVLAEPDATLSDNTWATLADGTPLVTAARRGKGLIVLFHVTGDTRWSNLPLSGTFVEMLKRIVDLAGTSKVAQAESAQSDAVHEAVAPSRMLEASVPLFLRRRWRGRCRPISPAAPQPIIRQASMVRRRAMWPSTRSRQPIGSSRSISVRSPMRTTKSIARPRRWICADRFSSPHWRCSSWIPWWFCSWVGESSDSSRGALARRLR